MKDKEKEITRLDILNMVYVAFAIVWVASIILNNLEKEDIINNTNEHAKLISNWKVILLIIFLLGSIYFLYDKYKNNDPTNELENNLDLGASGLFIIATLILIYLEIKNGNEIIDIV